MTVISYQSRQPRRRTAVWIGGFLISFLIASSTFTLMMSWLWLITRVFQWLPQLPFAMHFFIGFFSLPIICIAWPVAGVHLLHKVFEQNRSVLLIVGWLAGGAFIISGGLLVNYLLHDPYAPKMFADPWILLSISLMPLTCIAALWLVIVILWLLFRPGIQEAREPYLSSPLFRLYEDVCFATSSIMVLSFVAIVVAPKIREILNDFRTPGPPPVNFLLRLSGSPGFPLLLTLLPFLLALAKVLYRLQGKALADESRALPKIFSRRFLVFTLVAGSLGTILADVGIWYLRRGDTG